MTLLHTDFSLASLQAEARMCVFNVQHITDVLSSDWALGCLYRHTMK